MNLAIGLILCAIAVYSLASAAEVADTMPAFDIAIIVVTQVLFLAVGGYLIRSYIISKRK